MANNLDNPQKKLLLIILIILALSGIVYWEYTLISKQIDESKAKHQEVDQLNLQTKELKKREDKFAAMDKSVETVNNYLPTSDNIVLFIEQLENISKITNTKISLQFEPATISDGGIKFDDEKKKQEILNEIKNNGGSPQVQLNTQGNVALQLLEAQKKGKDEDTSLDFIDMNLIITGSYSSIIDYVVTLKQSKYLVEMYDMQMVALNDTVQATIQARLFIANQ